jgi:hypothetical protein
MGDELKSAYEVAMERLRARDGERGERPLSDEQKAEIAEVRAEMRAKRAELAILHDSRRAAALAAGDLEALARLEDEYGRETARLTEREEERVRAIRSGP